MQKLLAWTMKNWFLILFMVLLTVVLVRTAWISDDGFISFTSAANLIEGKGFGFQSYERVQSFSNPLWTMLVAAAYSITREVWITGMVLGMGISLGVGFLIFSAKPEQNTKQRGQKSHQKNKAINGRFSLQAIARALNLNSNWQVNSKKDTGASIATRGLGLLLLLSSAFIDFSTSGLENPLSHLLILLFAGQYLRDRWDARWLQNLILLASLLMLNRPDFAFLLAPALLWAIFKSPRKGRIQAVAIGLLPIVGWELFSLIYYGFLLPNTWYAKLGVGEDRWFLMEKGLVYAWDTLRHDPVTMVVILGGVGAAVFGGNRKNRLLMGGMLLYTLAVIAAGGDFMRGRMFTVPFVLSLYLLVRMPLPRLTWVPLAILIVLGMLRGDSPLWAGADYHLGRTENPAELYPNNITDERALYWKTTGWIANHGQNEHPMRVLQREARANRSAENEVSFPSEVRVTGAMGMIGYAKAPGLHLLDESALSDPLLARLPALNTQWWRAGHRPRVIPAGYEQHLIHVLNQWQDKSLELYAERMDIVTRGPIWSGIRWRTIWGFLTGEYAELVDREYYREPIRVFRIDPKEQVKEPMKAERWSPLQINLKSPVKADSVFIWAESGEALKLTFLFDEENEKEFDLKSNTKKPNQPGRLFRMRLPDPARSRGLQGLYLRASTFHRDLVVYRVDFN